MYADRTDIQRVLALLNSDNEVAFIVKDGPKRWKAARTLDQFEDTRYCIWVRSGGSLPLMRSDGTEGDLIENPWDGWTENRTGADSADPWFGPGHPAVVWLNVRTKGKGTSGIGLSSFEWIGNHYRIIGSPAPEAVEKWWQRLRRSIKKIGKRIPRDGPIDGSEPEIWALPSARNAIEQGAPRDMNPL
jgi:hypothetical protein